MSEQKEATTGGSTEEKPADDVAIHEKRQQDIDLTVQQTNAINDAVKAAQVLSLQHISCTTAVYHVLNGECTTSVYEKCVVQATQEQQ